MTPFACAVDPNIDVKLNATMSKLLLHALTAGAGPLAALLAKYAGLSGLEAKVAAEIIVSVATAVKKGINACINTYYAIGKVGSFRCGLNLSYLELPVFPYFFPEDLKIEDCFFDKRASGHYDCYPVEKIGWSL